MRGACAQEQFGKKVESLERLLKEERERAQAAERQMERRVEEQTAITDDAKIWHREKDILQQEVGFLDFLSRASGVTFLCCGTLGSRGLWWRFVS